MLTTPKEKVVVGLRPRVRRAPHAVEAWFIPGREPEIWLSEMECAFESLDECEGFVLPSSLQDRSPSGFLLVKGCRKSGGATTTMLPYRRLGERLWLPCDADLTIDLRGTELDERLHHAAAVFHPGVGLIGFEETDRVGVADFLGDCGERANNFSWAHPGMPVSDRLYAITATAPPTIEVMLGDVAGEIGQRPLDELPETPDEAAESGVSKFGKNVKLGMLNALNKLSGDEVDKDKAGWKERLGRWSQQRMKAIQRQQERELERLLHLMKKNPDEGLKYALPLSGGTTRGEAPPSSKLTRRSTNFDMGRLGGGQAASPWVVDWQKHYELSREYREAANRELRLGRHRHAAYIYAELLKDYREAANVLRQGKHFREASVLYLKHLGDPMEGARCLREGGFLLEAIPIFERKREHETAGELYEELGLKAEAHVQFRQAVSRALAHGNTVQAATLLEERLGEIDEAIALLQKTWPAGDDAAICLAHELSLYKRLEWHDAVGPRLGAVTADHPVARARQLMEVLVKQARRYPDEHVQKHAEHCCFTVAGRWLGAPNYPEAREMLQLIRELLPQDRLLVRDTARFQQQREAEAREQAQRSNADQEEGPLKLLTAEPLPSWVRWVLLEPRGRSGFYALGTSSNGLTLMRMRWGGGFQTQSLADAKVHRSSSHCRMAVAESALPEVVSVLGLKALPPGVMPPSDTFGNQVRVENPPWAQSEGFLGLVYGGSGVAWVLQREGQDGLLVLSSYSAMGDLIATHTLSLPVEALAHEIVAPIPMILAQEQIVFVYGQHLIRYYRDRLDFLELSDEPRALYHAPLGRLQLAVAYDSNAEIFWGEGNWGRRSLLDLPVMEPHVAFTRTGDVLALSQNRLDWLAYQKGAFVPVDGMDLKDFDEPLGIFPTEAPNVYALVSQSEVRLLRVTPWQLTKK